MWMVIVGWLTATALGCGDSGVKVDNDNPLGTVGGLVVDGASQMPLAGVSIKIISAGGTFDATSDANGIYQVPKVPAGAFTLELTKMGYLDVRLQSTLSGAIGNFPISSPIATLDPYGMVPIGPDFIVRVTDGNGAAVNGATATARMPFSYVNLASGTPQFLGSATATATTAADGRLVFKGLPDVQKFGSLLGGTTVDPALGVVAGDTAVVTVAPLAVTGQENYEYAGGIFPFRLLNLALSVAQIVLSGPEDVLKVLESNLEWLRDGFVGPSAGNPINGSIVEAAGPITIAFSEAIDPTSLRATVTTESGAVGPTLTPTVNLNLVSLAGTFQAGQRYNLSVSANAALNPAGSARQKAGYAPFFARPAASSKPTVVSAKITAVAPATMPASFTVTFTLSEPIGFGDGAGQLYDCVSFYEGANFDGSSGAQPNVTGEWASDPASLSCNTSSPVSGTAAALNNGRITGAENLGNPNSPPVTGYTSTFTTTIAPYAQAAMTTMAMPGVVMPAASTKGHLFFNALPRTVHRTTGEPVVEIPFTLQ
jgi:hypothetical protein